MKIINKQLINGRATVTDCAVDGGYLKVAHGSLPDVDNDFDAERREDIKAYLERRYNKDGLQRVFSAGTFTTAKIKSAIKGVARTYRIPVATVNYLTKIIEDDLTWTDFMRLAATDKRFYDFVQKYPHVFEEMLPIMGQVQSASIHASAVIITPEYIKGERVECFDLLPIRKMGDYLVSEISGAEIDSIGILKNDVLSIKELGRLSNMLNLIEEEYGKRHSVLEIASKHLNDPKVFETIRNGHTQGIFQISGVGMTRFIKRLAPDNINDLIASVAIYRPGPLQSGATENYVRAKNGEYDPQYLWGTYEVLSDTYSEIIYQEQVSILVQKIGNLSLGDGVTLVKAISKKKLKDVMKYKERFFEGAAANGCPRDAAEQIWLNVENATSYLFNRSHATTYGLTAYVDAWIKTYYPTVFYTVILKDQDKDKMAELMNEIASVSSIELLAPDINISGADFTADFKHNSIYWSLSRIMQLGAKAVNYILSERRLYGEFADMEDFIKRIFRSKFKNFDDDGTEEIKERCPVTARIMRNLIFAGAFDRIENVQSPLERYGLLQRAALMLGFELTEKEVPTESRDKHYYWSKKQIDVSGFGAIDYKAIFDGTDHPKSASCQRFIDFKDLNDRFYDVKRGAICATIINVTEKSYKDKQTGQTKHFGKVELQQNTETNILTIWDEWPLVKAELKKAVGKMVCASINVKWSDFDDKNTLQIGKVSFFKII